MGRPGSREPLWAAKREAHGWTRAAVVAGSGQFWNVEGRAIVMCRGDWVWSMRDGEGSRSSPGFILSDEKGGVPIHRDGTAVGGAGLGTAGDGDRSSVLAVKFGMLI